MRRLLGGIIAVGDSKWFKFTFGSAQKRKRIEVRLTKNDDAIVGGCCIKRFWNLMALLLYRIQTI